jgi:hypothetical protein
LQRRLQFTLCRFQLPLQHGDDIEQSLGVNPSFAHVLFELFDGVHAASLSRRPIASCASLLNFPQQTDFLGTAASRELTATLRHQNDSLLGLNQA